MKRAILILAMAVLSGGALAQQLNEQGCAYAADVAITSRALSAAGIERPQAERILLSMYTAQSEIAQRLRMKVTDAAYMSDLKPSEYSKKIFDSCLAAEGRMEKFLGVGV